jgi:hypothetical protein
VFGGKCFRLVHIESEHLETALAFCRYALDSAKYIFGETELNPIA